MITFLEKLLSDLAFVFRGILSSPYREEVLRKRGRAPRAILPGRGLPSLEEAQKLGEAWEEWYEEAYLFLARGYLDLAEKVRDSLGRRENVAFFRSGTDGFVGGWMVAVALPIGHPLLLEEGEDGLKEVSFQTFWEKAMNPPLPFAVWNVYTAFQELGKGLDT